MMEPDRVAGALLLAGSILFVFAASLPALYPVWTGDLATQLATLREHPRAWTLCHVCMTAAVILTAAGLGLLAAELAQPLAVAAAFSYAVGAAAWCVFEAYRLSVPPFFARAAVSDPPDWFSAAQEWSGRLFTIYMLTAYVALVGFGLAILAGVRLPAWSGWLAIAFGLAGAGSLATGRPRVFGASPFEPPVMIHVVPGVLAVLLLLHGPARF